jgi:hypothetical protein
VAEGRLAPLEVTFDQLVAMAMFVLVADTSLMSIDRLIRFSVVRWEFGALHSAAGVAVRSVNVRPHPELASLKSAQCHPFDGAGGRRVW